MTRDQGIQFRGREGEGRALLAPERSAQLIQFSFAAANSASLGIAISHARWLRGSESVDRLVDEIPSAADHRGKTKKSDNQKSHAAAATAARALLRNNILWLLRRWNIHGSEVTGPRRTRKPFSALHDMAPSA